MRILFVASLTHVEQMKQAVANTRPGETAPLFPSSMKEHFHERALRRRGHELAVFWRERSSRNPRFHAGFTPGKAAQALGQRLPPQLNPQVHQRNRQLLQMVEEFRPDVLWLVAGNRVILPETLASIRQAHNCRLVFACGTSPLVFSFPLEKQAAGLWDLALVNDYYHGMQLLELGARRVACLPLVAMDPDFHRPRQPDQSQRSTLACDVAFVGTLLPDHIYGERVRALAALRDFDPGIWSVHDLPAALRPFLRGEALGEAMLEILSAAKLTVNPHGQTMQYGGNMRLFEAAGVGTLQITDDRPGVHKWFTPGENILTFRDEADLRDKVAYFLAHDDEREEMARRAREHVLTHHRYDQRVEQVEALLAAL
ncbi:MAG: glycosyltransferase [Anaerolineaceae bacterium]|nr:glycosyltransferase [Anaerolineaceae bacterium]